MLNVIVSLVLSVRIMKAGKATGKAALLGSCMSCAQPAAVETSTHLETLNQLPLSPEPLLSALERADGQQFTKEEQSYPPGEDFCVLSLLLYSVSNPSVKIFFLMHFWLFYDLMTIQNGLPFAQSYSVHSILTYPDNPHL